MTPLWISVFSFKLENKFHERYIVLLKMLQTNFENNFRG